MRPLPWGELAKDYRRFQQVGDAVVYVRGGRPMTSQTLRTGLPWLMLVILGGALALLTVSPVINPPKWDEFIVIYDAHRVATGQVPYRDFFNFIPPGVFFALAVMSKAAGGTTLTLGRYAALMVVLATAVAFGVDPQAEGLGVLGRLCRRGNFPDLRLSLLGRLVPSVAGQPLRDRPPCLFNRTGGGDAQVARGWHARGARSALPPGSRS